MFCPVFRITPTFRNSKISNQSSLQNSNIFTLKISEIVKIFGLKTNNFRVIYGLLLNFLCLRLFFNFTTTTECDNFTTFLGRIVSSSGTLLQLLLWSTFPSSSYLHLHLAVIKTSQNWLCGAGEISMWCFFEYCGEISIRRAVIRCLVSFWHRTANPL